ncbi:angiotensin-converting enzyme-like [Dreissena polymorpha]|nr:angiotensin-converting enzyme-like [Dreissena polymorpha]XP_052286832.1 angiotensin-converting enzyme-like [Dreissena polymorpha]
MRLAFVAFVLVTFIATCFHARAADVAKAELDRLKEYLENVEFIEDEDALNSLTERTEEEVMRSACDSQMHYDEPLPDDVSEFVDDVTQFVGTWDMCLGKWQSKTAYADWNYETDLTDANAQKNTDVSVQRSGFTKQLSVQATKVLNHAHFSELDDDIKRQVRLLAFETSPKDPDDNIALETTKNDLQKIYSTATVNGLPLEPNVTEVMSHSRDPDVLLGAWWGWRNATGPLMKDKYERMIGLLNKGATDNGFANYADAWEESQFDSTDDIEEQAAKLWMEIKPLYEQLHAYVRHRLAAYYHDYRSFNNDIKFWGVFRQGAMPAHLQGNMWSQQWENIYDIVKPYPEEVEKDYDKMLKEKVFDAAKLFKMAEQFYTSIGLFPMTNDFWKYSMITKPEGRDVVCHASAFDFYTTKPPNNDFRIKMCTEINMDSFETIHHEMGHITYFMAYQDQPTVYRDGANSGFHEAIGDTISLSAMTRQHLERLLGDGQGTPVQTVRSAEQGKPSKGDINYLMRKALIKVAFLPFGYLIDKWRWDVMRGTVTKDQYNRHWWKLILQYQGLVSSVPRSEKDFDPGSKYHIPSDSPYICYFISFISQFQFYEAMCEAAGHQGPLYNCDFYQSVEAGNKLKALLQLGKSKPWPTAMEALTGSKEIHSSAILKYFKPLYDWLVAENARLKNPVGWKHAKINFE